jgi:Fe-S cluster assembly iron-binding protein IscA
MIITEAAVAKMSSILNGLKLEAPDTDLFFRIGSRHNLVLAMGCGGVRYGLLVDHEAKATDIVETHGDFEVRIDPVSWILVKTLTVELGEFGTNEIFVLTQDPDVTLCYCGSGHA